MSKTTDPNLKCSFCGKTQDQVKKLIAGPDVCICDECIELCNEILDEERLIHGNSYYRKTTAVFIWRFQY